MADNDRDILEEAKQNFTYCEEWEAQARLGFDFDYKFANGDAINLYQWDSRIVADRTTGGQNRPCLTINKTMQHCLQIINDMKQNKPGVNIRPVGEDASFEAAQIFQEIVRHIEYISNAEAVYDYASTFQVIGGIGYCRLLTDYISSKSFDQEIFIRRVKDPRMVYMDPDINEVDGSDARYGFIFDNTPKNLFDVTYPEHKDAGWQNTFDITDNYNPWYTRNQIRVAEYFRKTEKKDKFVRFEWEGTFYEGYYSKLSKDEKAVCEYIKFNNSDTYRERKVVTDDVQWYKIAGNKIIEKRPWLGRYIPIIRFVGTETIINGILDRKGHTRQLIDPQRMYNYNSSANVEFGALQTKVPWLASIRAVEGLEEYWRSANNTNHSWLPWNDIDETGGEIKMPVRPAPPMASEGYVKGLMIAQDEMMMASGQYQAQMGQNENAKSGVAINARQRQGDRATYHFIDNQAMAIRNIGKQLIDLIPKIYDTERVMRISANDGSILNVKVDPDAPQAFQKLAPPGGQPNKDKNQQMIEIIFNPNVGLYDVVSDTGPSFATKRQEAFSALIQIAKDNKEFMGIAGDILWKVADFPEAQVLAERWRKIIPPEVTGDAPDPKMQQAIEMATAKLEQMIDVVAKQAKEIADKEREFDIKQKEVDIKNKQVDIVAYDAITKRLTALGNSGPAIPQEKIEPLIDQVVNDGTTPPMEGARQAADGNWYVEQNGQHYRVDKEDA